MDISDAEIFGSGDSSSYHQESSSHPPFALTGAHREQRRGAYSRPKMASRQKKQRKGRNNANNRERTVTTLTEDPHTHYLVPTPSEEPAGAHMPQPFPGPATGKMHNNMPMGPQAYPMSGNFGFGYTAPFGSIQHTNMHQNNHQQQQPFFSPPQAHRQQMSQQQQSQEPQKKPVLPPGKNDLEILQNLKKMIKDGQHPFYRAIPSPAALANLYKGPVPVTSQPQGRRSDTGAAEHRNDNAVQSARTGQASRFSKAAGSKDVSNLNIGGLKIGRDSSGPPSAGPQPEPRSADLSAPPSGFSAGSSGSQDTSDAQRPGRYGYQARPGTQMNDSDPMVGDRSGRGGSGFDNVRPSDVAMDVEHSVYSGKDDLSRPGSWAPRGAGHASEDRNFGSERTITPRPPYAGGSANADAPPGSSAGRSGGPPGDVYDRDREPRKGVWNPQNDDRARDTRLTDSRRPSTAPEPRPFEAAAAHQPPVQRAPADPPVLSLDQRRPVDSRPPTNGDSHERPTDSIPPARDSDATRPPVDSTPQPDVKPALQPAPSRPDGDDVQSSRSSSVRPADPSAPLGPPPVSGESLGSSDDSSTRPSLKERMEQPATRPPRSFAEPAGAASDAHPQDWFKKRGGFQKNHHGGPYNGPPKGDRAFNRPPPSSDGPPPSSGGPPRPFRARSPSMDSRKMPPSPGSRGPRDYRGPPGRDISHDRGGGGGGYSRPDFNDARRAEGIDSDVPPPARYEGRPYSDFSPAPGDRGRPAYPPSPPPPMGGRGPPGGDVPPGRADYYSQYPPDRHDWDAGDDAYYKSRSWDRAGGPPLPSSERDRFERDYPPSRAPGWDARSDRDFVARDGYAAGPPHDDRYPPLPPREADRGRPPPAAYAAPYNSRVRPRSPSPVGRPGAPPSDGGRGPAKRPREDFGDYYAGGRPPPRRPPGEYPPPGSGGQASHPDWPPPASGSSAGTMGGGPPRDRDYRMRDPMDYPPPPGSYDRSRSPGPPGRNAYSGRGGYARGGDRGGYGMRPPPQ